VAVDRPAVHLREAVEEDSEFLFRVYASTRVEELAGVPWSDEAKSAFVRMQFDAQHAQYRSAYVHAQFLVVVHDDEPIGRLYLNRDSHDLRIMDIALLPAWRGRGIGRRLVEDLQAEAAAAGAIVSLHVEPDNPARRLYSRLGFRHAGDAGLYQRLEWRSP
jgi:ribosomal protein S18 acetylase RimI-like enzyme